MDLGPEPTPALGRNLESEPTGIGKGSNGSTVQKWLDQALNQKNHELGPEPTALVLFLHTGTLLWSSMDSDVLLVRHGKIIFANFENCWNYILFYVGRFQMTIVILVLWSDL